MPKIPRVMSTQHPDNVRLPFFAESPDMSGEDEIKEAYYAFSHLGCDEQMWDCEGKEVDAFVVRKLLTRYEHFFKEKRLGQDVFITLRVPNPTVEKADAKVLIETLEEIPRSFDSARLFYNEDIPPIFEVILPMTATSKCLNRIYYYYKDFIAGKQNLPFYPGDITIAEWVGEFKPETIQVIPLFEDREHILESHQILREYLKNKKVPYQRVFLARSDPAMNYGMVSAVLCNKIALQRLRRLSQELEVEIYPILGVGSAPFRGNLKPGNEDRVLFEYPDVQTYTVQSAFKYDYPVDLTIKAIEKLRTSSRRRGWDVDEKRCISIIDKVSTEYRRQVEALAPLINQVAGYVPRRRMRKLHIGLFGYSRSMGEVILPRAISFCAACYSIGLPPQIFGLNALDPDDLAYLKEAYIYFDEDVGDGLSYFNEDVFAILPDNVKSSLRMDAFDFKIDYEHKKVTSRIINALKENHHTDLQSWIEEAAYLRRFLG